jgi:hypothetical protein
LFNRHVTLTDGRTVLADEAYLTRSMMDPQADLVAGFSPVMPTYRGTLEPAEAAALIEFIKSLDENLPPPAMALPRIEPGALVPATDGGTAVTGTNPAAGGAAATLEPADARAPVAASDSAAARSPSNPEPGDAP